MNEHVVPVENRIKAWCQEVSYVDENLLVRTLKRFFTELQVLLIIEAISNVCPYCYNDTRGCTCRRDD